MNPAVLAVLLSGGLAPVPGPPVGPVADILLDFANSAYRVDGVTYASAALAGFPGAGTFNASGYTATGNQNLTGTVDLPGDFIIVCEYVIPPAGVVFLFNHKGPDNLRIFQNGTIQTTPAIISTATATRIAFGRSGGLLKGSADRSSVLTGAALAAQGSALMGVGNQPNDVGGLAWGVPIKSFAIYKQTLTDAQIQAL